MAALPLCLLAQQPGVSHAPVHPNHWVYHLLGRMSASDVAAERWLPGRRPASASSIIAVLDQVASANDERWSATAGRAGEWLRAEYGIEDGSTVRIDPVVKLEVVDRPDRERRALGVGGLVSWSPRQSVTLFAEPTFEATNDGFGVNFPRAGMTWQAGGAAITASRDRPRLGIGAHGGAILGGRAMLTGVSVAMAQPARPSGRLEWLEWVGHVDAAMSFSWIPKSKWGPAGAFVVNELRVRPHSRLLLGVQRTLVLVTRVDERPITWHHLGQELRGGHTPYGDSKLSLLASVRADVATIPVVPYLEWGLEDSSGMQDDPAMILGVQLPHVEIGSVPFGFRYEYLGVGEPGRLLWRSWKCCFEERNWYRHKNRPTYVDHHGDLVGHPLGGYGYQHRAQLEALVIPAWTHFRAGLIIGDRQYPNVPRITPDEDKNVLYGVVPGRSLGGFFEASVRADSVLFTTRINAEAGDGWRSVDAAFNIVFTGL